MSALSFLGVLFLCHSHATLSQHSQGDYPDANEVMQKLPQTYMLQFGRHYPKLICGYQVFYNATLQKKTYQKYDLFFRYAGGRSFNQPLYVKKVINYPICMGTRPEPELEPTHELQILFSDMGSCMIAKNPNPKLPGACRLMMTKETFFTPPSICLSKFQDHCGSTVFNYTIKDCPYPEATQ
uniref:Putative salivary lipocalin n=1 Tax=Ixodes ricinus TaxID=34613 RepID=A0A0K8R4R8_IXORI